MAYYLTVVSQILTAGPLQTPVNLKRIQNTLGNASALIATMVYPTREESPIVPSVALNAVPLWEEVPYKSL